MATKRSQESGRSLLSGGFGTLGKLFAARWHKQPRKGPIIVPPEYAGKWVAWDADGRTIVGSGGTAMEAKTAAEKAGVLNALFERIPRQEELRSMARLEVKAHS